MPQDWNRYGPTAARPQGAKPRREVRPHGVNKGVVARAALLVGDLVAGAHELFSFRSQDPDGLALVAAPHRPDQRIHRLLGRCEIELRRLAGDRRAGKGQADPGRGDDAADGKPPAAAPLPRVHHRRARRLHRRPLGPLGAGAAT